MPISYFIAKRYLSSNRRNGFLSFITNFAILGVMLGTAALIITLSVLDGFEREIKNKVVEFTAHIQITGFQNLPLVNVRETIDRLNQHVAGIKSISPYAAKEGMIRFHDAVDGIYLKGIEGLESAVAPGGHLVDGKFFGNDSGGERELVVGKKLATRLDAKVGDKVVIFALPDQSASRPKAMLFTICGIYESGMAEFDDVYAYTRLTTAQQFFKMEGAVSGYDILVDDVTNVDAIAKSIQDQVGYPHYIRTVFQVYRNLFSWVELQKKLSPILLSLIIVVATINIIGTLLMFVLEKTRAIGILKSLGATPSLINRIFILQGLGIALTGIVLGNIFAYTCCIVQSSYHVISLPSDIYYMSSVPIHISILNFAVVTVIAFCLCMVTTILPSRAAASLDPVKALKFG